MPEDTVGTCFLSKSVPASCAWCFQTTKLNLYVLPLKKKKYVFCSLLCLQQFRNIATCHQCGVATSAEQPLHTVYKPGKTFCSEDCLIQHNSNTKNAAQLPLEESLDLKASSVKQVSSPPILVAESVVQRVKASSTKSSQQVQSTQLPHLKTGSVTSYSGNDFAWDTYLAETGSSAAPVKCFKQSVDPPLNRFVVGMKLESQDPRNLTATCVATVIRTLGPRILLRLDGTDNRNDFWRMVDSETIYIVGHSEGIGRALQAPLGYPKSPTSWFNFMIKTLKEANLAPKECFVKEPPAPPYNMFCVGHKLEAVDRKNPHMICPATIGAIDTDQVQVTFDGWNGTFDYWCRFDSRELFPVGWCAKNGHPLQPPGRLQKKNISLRMHPVSASPSNEGTIYISSCHCGSFVDPKGLRSIVPKVVGPGPLDEVLKVVVQGLVDASFDTKKVFGILKTRHNAILNGGAVISVELDKQLDELFLPSMESEEDLKRFLELMCRDLGFCDNLLSTIPDVVCSKCHHRRAFKDRELSCPSSTKKRKSAETPVKATAECTRTSWHSSFKLTSDPVNWSVDDVVHYVRSSHKELDPYLSMLRDHEIDGRALVLLTPEMMIQHLGFKLGPALKLFDSIKMLIK